jgi:plastocyanin
MKRTSLALPAFAALLLGALPAFADDTPVQHISIKNKAFVPSEIAIPAGQKVKLIVKNEDNEPAEFESFELHREKVAPANSEVTVFVGPLEAGTYPFFNDFDPKKTTGKIIVK